MEQAPQEPVAAGFHVLAYVTHDAAAVIRARRSLLAARVFALAPLLLGTAIFVAWLLFRLVWLMVAGVLLLPIGTVSAFAGVICLGVYWWTQRRIAPEDRRHTARRCLATAALILANFPAAFVYMTVAQDLYTRDYVTIINNGSSRLKSFIVTGAGVHLEFGPIEPGKRARDSFHVSSDGALDFTASIDGKTVSDELVSYASSGTSPGTSTIVTFQPDGTYAIRPGG